MVVESQKVHEVWPAACTLLAERLSKDVFDRWISIICPVDITSETITLSVSNDFYLSWLEENYLPLIKDAVVAVDGIERDIKIQVEPRRKAVATDSANPSETNPVDANGAAGRHIAPRDVALARENVSNAPISPTGRVDLAALHAGASPSQRAEDVGKPVPVGSDVAVTPAPNAEQAAERAARRKRSGEAFVNNLNETNTFDKFIVGSSNEFAHAACWAVAREPGRAYNPLFMYGGVGLGKTHLMQAIGNYAIDASEAAVCYHSCEEFVNQYIEALTNSDLANFRKRYRTADILLIDDVQFLAGKEGLQEEFFHTFNALFDARKQIVLTSDRRAADIKDMEERLVNRFEWGLVTELEPPNVETRHAILMKKAEEMDAKVAPGLLQYMAEKIHSNVRRLEGALVRAVSYASITGIALTREKLDELLKDAFELENQEAVITMQQIQKQVADYYDIRVTDIMSKRRPASIAFPRQVAMYICRNMTRHSLPDIGGAFEKNHATVLHACRTIENKMQNDPAVRRTVETLMQKVGAGGGR